MKNYIAYFEGAAKDLQKLIDDPSMSVEENIKNMAITMQANAVILNSYPKVRKLPVQHL